MPASASRLRFWILLGLLLISAAGFWVTSAFVERGAAPTPSVPSVPSQPSAPLPSPTSAPVVLAPASTRSDVSVKSADGWTSLAMDDVVLDAEGRATVVPGTVFHGTTTAFENTASWILIDANDIVVASGSMTVDAPDVGAPGRFRVVLPAYARKPTAATGLLKAYEASAKDGEPIHVARLPVRFRP